MAKPLLARSSRHEQDCQVTSFQALAVALQHPAITSDPKTVCILLQTCQSWRAALQQCTAANMMIDMRLATGLREGSLLHLAQLAAWLPKHAGLVGAIDFSMSYAVGLESRKAFYQAAELFLALSLQHAAARAALHLHSFQTNCLSSAVLLQALPASLTQLHLKHFHDWCTTPFNSQATVRTLAQLTNLRVLHLHGSGNWHIGGQCLAAIRNLSNLKQLSLLSADGTCDLQDLPAQLQELTLMCASDEQVPLGHLSSLSKLSLYKTAQPGSSLPQSLTAMTLWAAGSESVKNLSVTTLRQLQQLELVNAVTEPDQWQALSKLPLLQQVSVRYCSSVGAIHAAPAWIHLSQLRSLCIDACQDPQFDAEDCRAFHQGLSAATSLTYLQLTGDPVGQQYTGPRCVYIKGLSQLQVLKIQEIAVPDQCDMLHLTALTNLTWLRLEDIQLVDDMVVAALVLQLKQLLSLEVCNCNVRTNAVLPALATATQLTKLCIQDDAYTESDDVLHLPAAHLSMLTALSNLKEFAYDMFAYDDVDWLWDDDNNRWR